MPAGITYEPIGVVRSPHTRPDATPVQPSFAPGFPGTVEIEPRFAPGLEGIEGFSHIILIVALHAHEPLDAADPANLRVVPFLADEARGVFATRSPRRPNQIGLSIVRLLRREGGTLHIEALDLLDGTPVLDVKPYVPQFDIVPNASEGWVGAVTSSSAARRGRRAPESGAGGEQRAAAGVTLSILVDDHEAEVSGSPAASGDGAADLGAAGIAPQAEHGLAIWIETAAGSVLFDTGAGDLVVANAVCMDAPLHEADAVVLSHGHYDHTGGLAAVLAQARFARLVAHPASALPRWSRGANGEPKDVGMPEHALGALAAFAARTTRVAAHVEVIAGIHVTGPIPRRRDDEASAEPFFLDREMTLADPLPDDQALWLETAEGPIVILGCAHSGVLATLDAIAELRGDVGVRAIIGGMHLLHADAARLERTVAELERRGVGLVAPGHCTGDAAIGLLGRRLGERCRPLRVGQRLSFR